MENKGDNSEIDLLYHFNNGVSTAYNTIFLKFYDELLYYANKLFTHTSIASDDILQEIFFNLWEKKKHDFQSIRHIKNYLYTSIQNKYKDYLNHRWHVEEYKQRIQLNEQELFTNIVETETFFLMKSVSDLLPEECAKIFCMYMEGWEIKDIADQLKKSPSTVYTQRARAIEILKEKFDKNLLLLILNLRPPFAHSK